MYSAVQEATEHSFQDLQENVNFFYDAPEGGRYRRTGQLRDSPQLDGIDYSGDTASGKIEIDTDSPHYDPAGRDTLEIYNYAEADKLIGNGGFFQRTEEKIEKNIEDAFGKRFN